MWALWTLWWEHWWGRWWALGCHGGRGNKVLALKVGNCNKTLIIQTSPPASPLQFHVDSMFINGFTGQTCSANAPHASPPTHHSYASDSSRRMMDFPLFEDVILLTDMIEEGLFAGDVGVVVERHSVPGIETGYSVEFFDMLGDTVAVVALPAGLRRPTAADRPFVRPVTGFAKLVPA